MNNSNPFSICVNMLKIRYSVYDESISSLNRLKPTDKVNVFINLETLLNYLSTIKDLEQKIILDTTFHVDMIADIINLAAHYKEFFTSNGLDTKVFLYMTDLHSETGAFHESETNMDFRCYYLNKYNGNPKFALMTEYFTDRILPKVKTICDFIPNVYFIQSKNIEGSLVPLIMSEHYGDRKNFIITGDMYDTQYEFFDSFTCHLYKRHFGNSNLAVTIPEYLKMITKKEEINAEEKDIFSNYGMYLLLLSCLGERYRSIDPISGVGLKTLGKTITKELTKFTISKNSENAEILSNIFEGFTKDCVKENYECMSVKKSHQMILDGEKQEILSQAVDRLDINSLKKLNGSMFPNKEHELRLESLLK